MLIFVAHFAIKFQANVSNAVVNVWHAYKVWRNSPVGTAMLFSPASRHIQVTHAALTSYHLPRWQPGYSLLITTSNQAVCYPFVLPSPRPAVPYPVWQNMYSFAKTRLVRSRMLPPNKSVKWRYPAVSGSTSEVKPARRPSPTPRASSGGG